MNIYKLEAETHIGSEFFVADNIREVVEMFVKENTDCTCTDVAKWIISIERIASNVKIKENKKHKI